MKKPDNVVFNDLTKNMMLTKVICSFSSKNFNRKYR